LFFENDYDLIYTTIIKFSYFNKVSILLDKPYNVQKQYVS